MGQGRGRRNVMSKTVWLITGAGRGMGTDIAKAALAAGHAVVATGRDPERGTAAIGAHDHLLAVKLDVTSPDDATKFGLEGWIESLAPEVAPSGIRTMGVEPGFFRTDLLTPESTTYAEPSIEAYAPRPAQTTTNGTRMNGKQGGDPAKLADALIKIVSLDEPPVRWVAGADAVRTVGDKGRDLIAQADAYRDLSSSLAHDDDGPILVEA